MFLVFAPGENKSFMIWDGDIPTPGKEVSEGSTVVPYEPINGDYDIHNYSLVEGKLEYTPVIKQESQDLVMDLVKFGRLFLQGYIEGVFTQSQVIDADLAQKIPDEMYRNAWLRGLIGNGSPEQQQLLFSIAEECNIPLPPLGGQ